MTTRLDWQDIRSLIEQQTGPVLTAEPVTEGLNSEIAVIVHTNHGATFVKGLRSGHHRVWTQQREAEINTYLGQVAPRLDGVPQFMIAEPPPNIHPCQRITTPDNEQVDIDTQMVLLVQMLWAMGLVTMACCQDIGESAVGLRDPERTTPSGHGGFVEYYRGYAWPKNATERRKDAPEHAPGHSVPRPSDRSMAAGILADARTPRVRREKRHRHSAA